MATKNLGKVFMTPKGQWDKTLSYTKLDIVTNKVGKISSGYIATTDIPKDTEIADAKWLKLFDLVDGDITDEYKALQKDVTNKATNVDTNKKAIDTIYNAMQKLYDVEISTTTPTNERTGLWVNPDDEQSVNIPELKDNVVNTTDTWSSQKVYTELQSLLAKITALEAKTQTVSDKIKVNSENTPPRKNLATLGQVKDALGKRDEKIDSLKEDISEQINVISDERNFIPIKLSFSDNVGKYINTYGTISTNKNFSISDLIPIESGNKKMRITFKKVNPNIARVAFLKKNVLSNDNVISFFVNGDNGTFDVEIPEGAKYVVVNSDTDDRGLTENGYPRARFFPSSVDADELAESVNGLDAKVGEISEKLVDSVVETGIEPIYEKYLGKYVTIMIIIIHPILSELMKWLIELKLKFMQATNM